MLGLQPVTNGKFNAMGAGHQPRRGAFGQVSYRFSAVAPTASLANNAIERSRILVTVRAFARPAPSIRLAIGHWAI